jgi:hypothetical protein
MATSNRALAVVIYCLGLASCSSGAMPSFDAFKSKPTTTLLLTQSSPSGGANLAWANLPYALHNADWRGRRLYGELRLGWIYATNIDDSLNHVRRRLHDGTVTGAQPRFALRDA